MFVNHTEVRMARTKGRGGQNLLCNQNEINGWQNEVISLDWWAEDP